MKRALPRSPRPSRYRQGFTLVEIMLVVIIIGMVAMLAFPTIGMAKTNARAAHFINDLRMARSIFETYALTEGWYPDDATPGITPTGMTDELDPVSWNEPTPIGGQWDWDYEQFDCVAGVSVFEPELTEQQMARIDARIDDGDLDGGQFRRRSNGYIYIIE